MKIICAVWRRMTGFLIVVMWAMPLFCRLLPAYAQVTPAPDAPRFWQTLGEDYRLGPVRVVGRKTWNAEPPIPEGRYWEPYCDCRYPLLRAFVCGDLANTYSTIDTEPVIDFNHN